MQDTAKTVADEITDALEGLGFRWLEAGGVSTRAKVTFSHNDADQLDLEIALSGCTISLPINTDVVKITGPGGQVIHRPTT